MRVIQSMIIASLLALAVSPASAYELYYCGDKPIKWSSNSKTLYANSISFPAGYWENTIKQTVGLYNRNPSKFRYGITTYSGGASHGNGRSEIWGKDIGAPAYAAMRWSCYWLFGWHTKMKEADVVFDYGSPWKWTGSRNKCSLIRYGGTKRSMQGTGLHEFGHGNGLAHEGDEYNIMGADFTHIHANGCTATSYVGEDASDGLIRLYGNRGGWEDVAVSHWRYTGRSGEYSIHDRTRIFDSSGNVRPNVAVKSPCGCYETGYRVKRGTWVKVEFTYENNGSSFQSPVRADYYVSTNDYISTWDRKVGSGSFGLGRANVYTTTKWIYIPSDLIPGRNYWMGVIIDSNNAIAEKVEANNATYIPMYVE